MNQGEEEEADEGVSPQTYGDGEVSVQKAKKKDEDGDHLLLPPPPLHAHPPSPPTLHPPEIGSVFFFAASLCQFAPWGRSNGAEDA